MSTPAYNSVAWFQIGSPDPDAAKRFYGSLFDWTYDDDAGYSQVTTPGAGHPTGGITDTKGEFPDHAIFMVVVEDVAASCERAEELGGKTLVPPTTTPDGLVFAHLSDLAGNHFGVFTPPRPLGSVRARI